MSKGGAAAAPAKTLSPAEQADDLFRSLKAQITADDSKAIVETCKKLLVLLPKDGDVLRCYATALLQTGQYQQCLDVLAVLPAQPPVAVLERAYAHYRLNQLPQALTLLGALPAAQKTKPLLHLEAQVQYRLGAFQKSVEIYERHFSPIGKADHELRTNFMAAYIGAGQPEKALALAGDGAAAALTYELAYNTACALIDNNEFAAAGRSLETARKLCKESLADLSAAELADELASIEAQSAFVLQSQGQTDAAHKIYSDIIALKPSDSAVLATASNNIITLRAVNEKVFDSLKRANRAVEVADHKLSPRQKSAIHLNRALLLMAAAGTAEGTRVAEQLRKEFADSEFPVLVLAAMYYGEKNYAKCEEILTSYIKAQPKNCLQSLLTLAHIPLSLGKLPEAIKALAAIAAVQHRPAVVATLMALHERSGDVAGAGKTLDAAIAYWSTQSDAKVAGGSGGGSGGASSSVKHTLNVLLEKAAEFRLKNKQYAEAVSVFERLVKAGAGKSSAAEADDTARSIATLILAASNIDAADANAARALQYSSQLPPLPGVDALRANIAALEAVSAPRSDAARRTRKVKAADGKDAKDAKDGKDGGDAKASAAAKDKKKKRKRRLPKGYDPANPPAAPDPERWLPRWQRKSGKKLRKRKDKQREFRGAQGATLTEAEKAATVSSGDNKDSAAAAAVGTPAAGKSTVNLRTAQKAAKRSKKGKKGGW